MAKRGPPSKLHEVMSEELPMMEGPFKVPGAVKGMTRGDAALLAASSGARQRHVAGAAGVTVVTLHNWLKDPGFLSAHTRARSHGVTGLLALARGGGAGSGAAVQLLAVCFGYHHSRAAKEWEPSDEVRQSQREDVLAIIRGVLTTSPHLVDEVKAEMDTERRNREPEGVP